MNEKNKNEEIKEIKESIKKEDKPLSELDKIKEDLEKVTLEEDPNKVREMFKDIEKRMEIYESKLYSKTIRLRVPTHRFLKEESERTEITIAKVLNRILTNYMKNKDKIDKIFRGEE